MKAVDYTEFFGKKKVKLRESYVLQLTIGNSPPTYQTSGFASINNNLLFCVKYTAAYVFFLQSEINRRRLDLIRYRTVKYITNSSLIRVQACSCFFFGEFAGSFIIKYLYRGGFIPYCASVRAVSVNFCIFELLLRTYNTAWD